jgi:hypothetical protein
MKEIFMAAKKVFAEGGSFYSIDLSLDMVLKQWRLRLISTYTRRLTMRKIIGKFLSRRAENGDELLFK